MRFLYTKKDRISNSKDIQKLFHHGEAFFSFPIRLIYAPMEGQSRERSAVIAPKRNLRKAHERNRVKRLLRELIRHQLPHIRADQSHPLNQMDFLIVYTHMDPHVTLQMLRDAYDHIILDLRHAQHTP